MQQRVCDIVRILSSEQVELWDRSNYDIKRIWKSDLRTQDQADLRLGNCIEVTLKNNVVMVKVVNEELFTVFEGEAMVRIQSMDKNGFLAKFGHIYSYARLPGFGGEKSYWLKRNPSGDKDKVFWRVAQVGYGFSKDITPGEKLSYTGVCICDTQGIKIATIDGKLFNFNPMGQIFTMRLGAWIRFEKFQQERKAFSNPTKVPIGTVDNYRFVGIDPPVETVIDENQNLVEIKLDCKWRNEEIVCIRFPDMTLSVSENIRQMFNTAQHLIVAHFTTNCWFADKVEKKQPTNCGTLSERATMSDPSTSLSQKLDDAERHEILQGITKIVEDKQMAKLMQNIDQDNFSKLRRTLFHCGYLEQTLKEEMKAL